MTVRRSPCSATNRPTPTADRTSVRRFAAIAAASLIAFALLACNGDAPQSSAPAPPPAAVQEQQQPDPQPPTQQPEPDQDDQPSQTQQSAQPEQEQPAPADQADQSDQAEPPGPTVDFNDLRLSVEPILDGQVFEQPIDLVVWPGGGLLIAEQRGSVTLYQDDGRRRGVLDLSGQVRFRGEEGLLSIALGPDWEQNPFLYVYYSPRDGSLTRLSRFDLVAGSAVAASELIILEIPQPFPNHNGGAIRFGPDGMLYLGLGDGGAANDPRGHGQNRSTLLGAIIRIDVSRASADQPYRVPPDNPFLGVADTRPEIYAWGLRNPWRMAFDPETGDLWAGDVGQNRVEEIDIIRPGLNYGWNTFEGDECFTRQSNCDALTDHEPPVAVYGRDQGCSVTGGVVYRGDAIDGLNGAYLYADYCTSRLWGLAQQDGDWTIRELVDPGAIGWRIVSFAVDEDGEALILTSSGPILRLIAAPDG